MNTVRWVKRNGEIENHQTKGQNNGVCKTTAAAAVSEAKRSNGKIRWKKLNECALAHIRSIFQDYYFKSKEINSMIPFVMAETL